MSNLDIFGSGQAGMDIEVISSDSKINITDKKKDDRPHSANPKLHCPGIGARGSQSTESLKLYQSWVSTDKWMELRKLTDIALRERRIFSIKGGGFSSVRNALLERGWMEKVECRKTRSHIMAIGASRGLGDRDLSRVDRLIISKFLEHQSVDLLWTTKRDKYDWILSKKDVLLSRFCRSFFTSKEGLCASLSQPHWFTEPGVAIIYFPRCYNLHSHDQMEEFIDDFRLTACISLLKWLSGQLTQQKEEDLVSVDGKVPLTSVEFSMKRLQEHMYFVSHKDIDENDDKTSHIWEHEWDLFLTHHYLLVHEKAKFYNDKRLSVSDLEKQGAKMLIAITKYWPQMKLDGVMNIWIVKPGNKCRGRGIQLMNNIKDITAIVNNLAGNAGKARYVVQKYIENPLVVYNTKFDIRQWFLITCSQPLTIWMYKDSYLRFSSQIFNLSNYHESVHLTNNAIQSKYKNHCERDKALPDENMWDCHTFKAYLRQIGQYNMWDDRIYPGMKQCLIGAMLASQDGMDKRPNSFELFGADFMLTNDFTPWLIEINSSPDLAPTTSVTARLCPQCLEDIIKVVIDRRNNPEADTGMFEMVYKQVIPRAPAYLGLTLSVNGKKILNKSKPVKTRIERDYSPVIPKSKQSLEQDVTTPHGYNGPIITDFMAWLHPFEYMPINQKDNVEKDDALSMVQVLTVVKSGLLLKSTHKIKRKSSKKNSSFRSRSIKKEKTPCEHESSDDVNFKAIKNHVATPASTRECKRTEAKPERSIPSKKSRSEVDSKSVGNKRCYIEPSEIEAESFNSASRVHSSYALIHNVPFHKKDIYSIVTPRVISPGIMCVNKIFPVLRKSNKKYGNTEIIENVSMNTNVDIGNSASNYQLIHRKYAQCKFDPAFEDKITKP